MPFTGGYNPSPEQTGGGDGSSNGPLLQRVFESIATARGQAFDQTLNSSVGAENMALARAITFDLYGANVRFANEMNPATATAAGNLPRWEAILGQPSQPGDTESQRQARCAAALGRFGRTNSSQPVIDILTATLGALFVGLTLFTPSDALVWWPAYGGGGTHGLYAPAQITAVSGNQVTVANLTNVPTAAPGARLTLANCTHPGNDSPATGFLVQSRVSSSSVVVINNGSPVSPDNGVGGTPGSPTIAWTMPNPAAPWLSTVAHVDVLVNPTAIPGYTNADGTVNAKFYAAVNAINPILDLLLPADCTFDWYVYSSHGAIGWYFDEQDFDLEAFDS